MKDTNAKSINALMKHLRNVKNLRITGSKGKNDLRNIGYYHGYKGYRFYNKSNNSIPFTDFSEVNAVYDFDMKLKAWFYPHIMFLETALKNRVLEFVLAASGKSDFGSIYDKTLNFHSSYPVGSKAYREQVKEKIQLRERFYSIISQSYKTSPIVQHFYYNNQMVPIWGIFELITLGEFGRFYHCLNVDIKLEVCDSLGIDRSMNTSGELLTGIIYTIKDLRNAIAHNSPIFDVRFKDSKVSTILFAYIEQEFHLPKPNPYYGQTTRVNFEQVVDYFLLIMYFLKKLGKTKTELKKYTREFQNIFDELRNKVPTNIYREVVAIEIKNKLSFVEQWIKLK